MLEDIEKALQSEWRITLYRNVLNDPLVGKFISLLKELGKAVPVPSQILQKYYEFATDFIPVSAVKGEPGRNPWQDYIVNLIALEDNFFTRQAEVQDFDMLPQPIKTMAERDLAQFRYLASLSGSTIKGIMVERMGKALAVDHLPEWEGIYLQGGKEKYPAARSGLLNAFNKLVKWEDALKTLCDYYRENGVGIFGRYYAFRWVNNGQEGKLVGVNNPDGIKINRLYEYEREQRKVLENTEQFLRGYPANNVLLYGDRGTGKSSTVKALVNQYGSRGLRLIEIQKQDLGDFPLIISLLADRPQRFILFIDDLSFSDQEGQFRELKALLEGGVEARPQNVLVYATSNRRHLVQESHADRTITGYDPEQEEVRYMDTLQEKLSLADRFGITVTFTAPDQKRYLAIVEKLAEERGLEIDGDELRQRALKWELSFNSRSARTARQFVDYLQGQLALEKEK